MLGYLRDHEDRRDRLISAAKLSTELPRSVLPKHGLEPRYQVGQSCTGSIVHAYRIGEVNHGRECPKLSALHNYWLSRNLWGGTSVDGGSYLRSAVQALVRYGAAPEDLWAEDLANIAKRPTPFVQRSAHKLSGSLGYYRIENGDIDAVKRVLANGYAILGGWYVDEAFLDVDGPTIIDKIDAPECHLGHAMVIDGYSENLFHVPQSWRGWRGTEFAQAGCWMTRELVAQADDLWAIVGE